MNVQQGNVAEAIELYQQSLALQEQIGNLQGKAATLHALATVYRTQGNVAEAIELYQQSLALQEQIGNLQGKAATLHELATVYRTQGNVAEAIELYQQSLALQEQIGDVQGKAATFAMLGDLLVSQGQFQRAIPMLQASIAILQHLQSPDAETVMGFLHRAIAQFMQTPAGEPLRQAIEQNNWDEVRSILADMRAAIDLTQPNIRGLVE